MTDPLDALHQPIVPVGPDPGFAANLRARLERALLDPTGVAMTSESTTTGTAADPAELPWPPALTPYIAVADARRALEWYVEVFDAERRGEPYVMPDGSIGHAELGIGDAVLMLAEGYPEEGMHVPAAEAGTSVSLHVQVPDVDATVRRALAGGAQLVRDVADQPYGRTGVLSDPFGHRWMVQTPPARATRARHGDIGYVTMMTPDLQLAQDFYGAVLGWRFAPGNSEQGRQVENVTPMTGVGGGHERPEVWLCYRVADIDAACRRVRERGGEAEEPTRQPYGRLAECLDDQGLRFHLWQPPEG